MIDRFEERPAGRGVPGGWAGFDDGRRAPAFIPQANYVAAGEEPQGRHSLHVERQGLPPRSWDYRRPIWPFHDLLLNNPAVA